MPADRVADAALAEVVATLPAAAWPNVAGSGEARVRSATTATARAPREAYATLLTTADSRYLAGALALGSSIRALESNGRPMVALVTPTVPKEWRTSLGQVGWTVRPVAALSEFWWGRHERCARFTDEQV